MTTFTVDPAARPDACYRIDTFTIPEEARAELEATMHRNMELIRALPGFLGHVAFEKDAGPASFDLVTVATWESAAAMARAGEAVRAHYQAIGLDLPATLARWGVTMERGDFVTPARLQ